MESIEAMVNDLHIGIRMGGIVFVYSRVTRVSLTVTVSSASSPISDIDEHEHTGVNVDVVIFWSSLSHSLSNLKLVDEVASMWRGTMNCLDRHGYGEHFLMEHTF